MPSHEEKLIQLRSATEFITQNLHETNYLSIINENYNYFKNLRLIISSDEPSVKLNLNGINIEEMNSICSSANCYFPDSGLFFYSDQIVRDLEKSGQSRQRINYSFSFDSNVSEAFRLFNDNKTVTPSDKFESVLYLIKQYDLNFDYIFFILENLPHLDNLANERPFSTIKALKRFDNAEIQFKDDRLIKCNYLISNEDAGKLALETIHKFKGHEFVENAFQRQSGLYLLILKSIQLYLKNKKDYISNLSSLISYSMKAIGKFARLELYFCWKILKNGQKLSFFQPITSYHKNILFKAKSISWDLFFIRHQEFMACNDFDKSFQIPFYISFDNKFINLVEACPIKCLIIDDEYRHVQTIFKDEDEFSKELSEAITTDLYNELNDPALKIHRLNSKHRLLKEEIEKLENQIIQN
jgi:hypothetical protein